MRANRLFYFIVLDFRVKRYKRVNTLENFRNEKLVMYQILLEEYFLYHMVGDGDNIYIMKFIFTGIHYWSIVNTTRLWNLL